MLKYLIIVEGIADIIFLRDYLIFLNSNLKIITKKITSQLILKSKNITIKIIKSNSYNAIPALKTKINDDIAQKYKVLIIQDTDDITKDDGGIKNRIEYLDKIQKSMEVKFEIFLFPNHKDDGDLETLLLKIADFKNYDTYMECLHKFIKKEHLDEMIEDKDRIFNYIRMYYGKQDAKERNREYITEYWDLKSDALKPLKKFIEENII